MAMKVNELMIGDRIEDGYKKSQVTSIIEILVKNAYKAGYACAVDKTEEWLDDNLCTGEDCFGNTTAMPVDLSTSGTFIERYLKEIEL